MRDVDGFSKQIGYQMMSRPIVGNLSTTVQNQAGRTDAANTDAARSCSWRINPPPA